MGPVPSFASSVLFRFRLSSTLSSAIWAFSLDGDGDDLGLYRRERPRVNRVVANNVSEKLIFSLSGHQNGAKQAMWFSSPIAGNDINKRPSETIFDWMT